MKSKWDLLDASLTEVERINLLSTPRLNIFTIWLAENFCCLKIVAFSTVGLPVLSIEM